MDLKSDDESSSSPLLPMSNEKHLHLDEHSIPKSKSWSRERWISLTFFYFVALYCFTALIISQPLLPLRYPSKGEDYQNLCPQPPFLAPPSHPTLDSQRQTFLTSSTFRNASADTLSRLVSIRTESYDNQGPVGEDVRWESFKSLHQAIEEEFVELYKSKQIERIKVNRYGLLYIWKGSEENLKPILLMAHQDTVPVDPNSPWLHPHGYNDGKFIWGNGACDCKGTLTAILITLENLLKGDFKPKRGIIVSFGFDEESKGTEGAGRLGAYLEERFGRDRVELIVDEGSSYEEYAGVPMALIDVTEKGYVDVTISVEAPGGHSSVPPPHTSIGILASTIVDIENSASDAFTLSLEGHNPLLNTLECATKHGNHLSPKLRKAIIKASQNKNIKALRSLAELVAESSGDEVKYLMKTSLAVDLIDGGVKINALPEHASTVINFRVAVHENVQTVKDFITNSVKRTATKFNLSFDAFGSTSQPHSNARGIIRATSVADLEPAIVSTSTSVNWDILTGTIKTVWTKYRNKGDIIITPAIMQGNTDTHSYRNLTSNIYRLGPYSGQECINIHTINERFGIESLVDSIVFFHELIRNICS